MILITKYLDSYHISRLLLAIVLSVKTFVVLGQGLGPNEFAFVSDTQEPMGVEKAFLKENQNDRATQLIFSDLVNQKPKALFILGDVVMLGYKNKKWKKMDNYLAACREAGIPVTAILGNHDVMTRKKKGERTFQERFPLHVKTGYFQVVDSVAVILLNSNFTKLSSSDILKQKSWLLETLAKLDADPAIVDVIVTCHHAPYTNSKIVGSSMPVQVNFVPAYIQSKKSKLFITGHAHAFEHFKKEGKDFLTIGGGGGIHQPLNTKPDRIEDLAGDYKPMFHYLTVRRNKAGLMVTSHFLKEDFSGLELGLSFSVTR